MLYTLWWLCACEACHCADRYRAASVACESRWTARLATLRATAKQSQQDQASTATPSACHRPSVSPKQCRRCHTTPWHAQHTKPAFTRYGISATLAHCQQLVPAPEFAPSLDGLTPSEAPSLPSARVTGSEFTPSRPQCAQSRGRPTPSSPPRHPSPRHRTVPLGATCSSREARCHCEPVSGMYAASGPTRGTSFLPCTLRCPLPGHHSRSALLHLFPS
jgi:hypothetical protein